MNNGVAVPDEEEQGRHHLGRGDSSTAPGEIKVVQRPRSRWSSRRGRSPRTCWATGTYKAKNIIIATGARPRVLPGHRAGWRPDLDLFRGDEAGKACPSRWWSWARAPSAWSSPRFYRSLGAEVTVVELLPQILPVEDAEIAAMRTQALREARHQDPHRRQGHQGRQDQGRHHRPCRAQVRRKPRRCRRNG